MASIDPDTSELLHRSGCGDAVATDQLLARNRGRLRQMIAVNMDERLAARIDPSDVIQEAMIDAYRRLPDYLRDRPVPFYPWLRKIAWEHLVRMHERHLHAAKRSIVREEPCSVQLPDRSAVELADRLVSSGTSPSDYLLRAERRRRVREALSALAPHDRQLLLLRYLEQLSTREIAAVLQVREGAVKTRHFRAIQRLHRLLGDD
jgi:RNA polymerase sigma-70 factor, ECF subfamily